LQEKEKVKVVKKIDSNQKVKERKTGNLEDKDDQPDVKRCKYSNDLNTHIFDIYDNYLEVISYG